jgi:CRP-like cAMP-binding protein
MLSNRFVERWMKVVKKSILHKLFLIIQPTYRWGNFDFLEKLFFFSLKINSLMEKLQSYFQSLGFDQLESKKITSYFKKQLFNKGEHFVTQGKITLELAYLEKGQFQYYSVATQLEERTTYISLENTFVASLLSYLNEIPAKENIRALTNATLWIIEKKDVISLQNQMPSFKDFYLRLLEYQICCIDKARFDFIMLTGEERYAKLLEEEPELLQKIPLQYIASMLGITPRHLSRLRNKI